jgi:hypothetical protein
MTYNLEKLSIKLHQDEINKLRLRRHSSVKRSNRKKVSELKEEILGLNREELSKLKELVK